ncbi:MAG: DUF664 domain-containing protein [Chloroflexi bacterium]|nr:MAG: DUF664 domain-containing protein [Chloroflexota bacterium]TMF36770.1 MAG: DUF664 domain-containing protein [Chloroflexota bacterium]
MATRVIDFFAGWEDHNKLLVRTTSHLRDEDLALSAGEGLWPIRMLACHIVAARAWWFSRWMGEGDQELHRLSDFDEDEGSATRGADEICVALEKSWADVRRCLEKWTADDLNERFQRPRPNAAGERPWRDRRYIIWHVAEHDVHHGGEISLTLGMHGRPGLDM